MKTSHIITASSIGLFSLTILSGVILSSNTTSADTEVIDQVRLTVPIACTMTGENTSHTATLDPGTYSGATGSEYANGIGKTTLTAICNDDNGFSIYAIGYTGNSYDSENHTKLVGANTGGTIATKAYASGDTTSNWSMKLTKVDNPQSGDPITYNPQNLTIQSDTEGSFDIWHSVPASYTKVAEYHANTGSSTTDTTLGVKLETTYAAFVASNQPADTYIGQVKYTMVHPYTEAPLQPQTATSGCINYFPNGSNVEGTMGCQSISSTATSATLLASNFSRTGYGFAGWSNKFDYATNPNQEGIKFYGPQEIIFFTKGEYTGSNNGLALYAVWVKSEGSIQDSTKVSEVCNRLTTAPTDGTANLSSVSALTDQRDNNTYAIAKLADGNCWMIENLRLDNTADHNSDGTLAQGYGTSSTYGNFGGLAGAESANFAESTTANSLYYSGTQSGNATINIGTTDNPGYRMPRYNNNNTSSRASNPTGNGGNMYSYGNYYTWSAAMANTTYYDSPTATDADDKTSETVNTSLCPTGWRLPYGRNTGNGTAVGGFYNLNYKINNDSNVTDSYASLKLRSFPNNFLYSGFFIRSSADNRGVYGDYWSSSPGGFSYSYRLYLSSSQVSPGTGLDYKYYGNSIRCTLSAGT